MNGVEMSGIEQFGQNVLAVVIDIAMVMIGVAMAATFGRLVRGPTLPDRVVALDLMALFVVAAIGTYGIRTGQSVLILPAIVLGLIMFVGTVAFAMYVEKGAPQ